MSLPLGALASGNDVDVRQSNDMNNQTAGSVSHSSEAWGFSYGLGDVDINDCLGSTQWGTILVSKQKLVLNKWCAAEVYDAKGLRHMAAVMRCDIPEIAKHFPDSEHCIVANKMSAPPRAVPPPVIIEDTNWEEEEERHEIYEQRIAALEQKTPPPARVTREIIQQPRISEAQRKALAEVIAE